MNTQHTVIELEKKLDKMADAVTSRINTICLHDTATALDCDISVIIEGLRTHDDKIVESYLATVKSFLDGLYDNFKSQNSED